MASRPLRSGLPTVTWRSNRPGRSSAGSRMSWRLVAAMTTMPAMWLEAVHLDEQLVQRLLALLVAERVAAAAAADGVELVDEDDAGRVAAGILEQPSHARGADAGVHLDEIGAAREEERHAGFAGDRAREQRLAGSRRADEQHALRDAAAHRREASGLRRKSTISLTSSFASSTPATSWNVMTVSPRSATRARPEIDGMRPAVRAIDGEAEQAEERRDDGHRRRSSARRGSAGGLDVDAHARACTRSVTNDEFADRNSGGGDGLHAAGRRAG